MDPIAELDAFANLMADVVAEALVKTALIASRVGLTIVCGTVILARRRNRG